MENAAEDIHQIMKKFEFARGEHRGLRNLRTARDTIGSAITRQRMRTSQVNSLTGTTPVNATMHLWAALRTRQRQTWTMTMLWPLIR